LRPILSKIGLGIGGLAAAFLLTNIWVFAYGLGLFGCVAISWLIEWAWIRARGVVDLHRGGVVVRGWRGTPLDFVSVQLDGERPEPP
jgi:hypothetical protein